MEEPAREGGHVRLHLLQVLLFLLQGLCARRHVFQLLLISYKGAFMLEGKGVGGAVNIRYIYYRENANACKKKGKKREKEKKDVQGEEKKLATRGRRCCPYY
jgi:hypothetical protein